MDLIINQSQMTMNTIKLFIFGTFTFCFIQACDDKPKTITENLGPVETNGNLIYKGDTINRQYNGVRQGHFVVFENGVQRDAAKTESSPSAVNTEVNKQNAMSSLGIPIEEGDYKDGKKQGTWTYYNPDGSIKNTVEYKDDVPVKN
jgi:antitoxin component YwqK of YwqJK toxin-antitoxin module